MKGIILAGGRGTRLQPATRVISKQLLPVYDKPMIYYPLTTLMLANIKDILIITTEQDVTRFQELLGDGKKLGISIQYAVQHTARGIADAFLVAEDFIQNSPVCLILGDNIFYGRNFIQSLQNAAKLTEGATVFAYRVKTPEHFGVIEFDLQGKPISIEEKPTQPKSNYAVTGLYFYDAKVVEFAHSLKPSARGELEITDINRLYLERQELSVELLSRGMAWMDTGTHQSILDAAIYIRMLEEHQGIKISCPEEIAWRLKFITTQELFLLAEQCENTQYRQYLEYVATTPHVP